MGLGKNTATHNFRKIFVIFVEKNLPPLMKNLSVIPVIKK